MTSPPFILGLPTVVSTACCWHSYRTWCWLAKSTHLISFYFILHNTTSFLLIGRLEWASLNISCCISNSLPLMAPILYFLRAVIFASALHKILMMTEFLMYYAVGFIYFLDITVWLIFSNLKFEFFTLVDVIFSRRFVIYLFI